MMPIEWTMRYIAELVAPLVTIERIDKGIFGEGSSRLVLPIPKGAEYGFQIHVYEQETIQIHAELIGLPKAYFWYEDFELCSLEPIELLKEQFLSHLGKVLKYPTYIEQKRGWFFCDFSCWYYLMNEWKPLPGVGCLQNAFDVPEIDGKTRIYHSPALLK